MERPRKQKEMLMQKLRSVLKHTLFIHFLAILGLFALFGFIMTDNRFTLLGVYLSAAGAVCGSFIKVVDLIKEH